ncbi:MAG TPA: GGDEF domain-containing protein [bacterium]|nr:GGDEF domain-containing protein [bacterium]HPN30293.1 GGDEF domain-containing protein [bacterium]
MKASVRNILVIDSEDSSRKIYVNELAAFAGRKKISVNIFESETAMESIVKIKKYLPNIVVINYFLTDMSGADIIERILIEFKKKFDHIFIIVLIINGTDITLVTPEITSVTDVIAVKSVVLRESPALEKHYREIFDKIENKINNFNDIYVDELTKAYNRKWLTAFMNGFIVKRGGEINDDNSGIIIGSLDINKFKNINDTFGHEIGDMVLKNLTVYLSDFITDIIPLYFYIVRIGGDEFLFIIPINKDLSETFKEEFGGFGAFIRKKGLKDMGLRLGVSVGIDYCDNASPESVIEKIKKTDSLMYEDKKESRSKF